VIFLAPALERAGLAVLAYLPEMRQLKQDREIGRRKKDSAARAVNLLRQIGSVANGRTMPQACKEAGIVEQTRFR
jgi:hypothetical protein